MPGCGGRRETIPITDITLYCHHQNDSYIKMGSDDSHFNVSLTVRDSVTRQCPQPQLLKTDESRSEFKPRSLLLTSLNALPLGQTCSRHPREALGCQGKQPLILLRIVIVMADMVISLGFFSPA